MHEESNEGPPQATLPDRDSSLVVPLFISGEGFGIPGSGGGQLDPSAAISGLAGCSIRNQALLGSNQDLRCQAEEKVDVAPSPCEKPTRRTGGRLISIRQIASVLKT